MFVSYIWCFDVSMFRFNYVVLSTYCLVCCFISSVCKCTGYIVFVCVCMSGISEYLSMGCIYCSG